MQQKKIKVKEVFKSTSEDEASKFIKDKIVKLMINQQKIEAKIV